MCGWGVFLMFKDLGGMRLAGSQRGVTLVELMVAMLLLVMVTSMLYSVLNVGIKFSQKGEARLAVIERERSFLNLLHRQIHGVWYDKPRKKLMIDVQGNLLKMVTTAPLIERHAGLVMAVYLYDSGDRVIYYTEKLDYYNDDYNDSYSPSPEEMVVLLSDVDEIGWQYDQAEGEVAVSYLGQNFEILPRSWRPVEES